MMWLLSLGNKAGLSLVAETVNGLGWPTTAGLSRSCTSTLKLAAVFSRIVCTLVKFCGLPGSP